MRNLLFVVLIGAFLMVGTADAAGRGAWIQFGNGDYSETGGTAWMTVIHITNNDSKSVLATVTFYGNTNGTALGSTTRMMTSNAIWGFGSDAIGNIATSVFNDSKGVVTISPSTLDATTSMFYTGTASGFNFSW